MRGIRHCGNIKYFGILHFRTFPMIGKDDIHDYVDLLKQNKLFLTIHNIIFNTRKKKDPF